MQEKPYVPKDPVVIGKTVDGQPVWMEPKDLIPTPDEELERVANTMACREDNFINKMAQAVLENAGRFIQETFLKTASRQGTEAFLKNQEDAFAWAVKAGYEAIQDGLKTVVKVRGRVVREMTATVAPCYRDSVAREVMRLVKQLPAP